MISLEIGQSPDNNVLSSFRFHQNQIYLGRNSGDLWINDPAILPSHAMLEVIGKDLLFHPQKNVEFYLLNGKRSSSIRKLKNGDEITVGKTVIKIIGFEETVVERKKDLLNRKLSSLIQENAPRLSVIEKLTKLMKP